VKLNQQATVLCFVLMVAMVLPVLAVKQTGYPGLPADKIDKVFPSKPVYSPYANRNFPSRPLFGDQHQHTAMSKERKIDVSIL